MTFLDDTTLLFGDGGVGCADPLDARDGYVQTLDSIRILRN